MRLDIYEPSDGLLRTRASFRKHTGTGQVRPYQPAASGRFNNGTKELI